MNIRSVNLYTKKVEKMPDYPKKDDNIDSYNNGKTNSSPDYYDYKDEYSGGGGGNYYEYSGPDGSYSYDPYH